MKKNLLPLLMAALLGCLRATAQQALLPYGQLSQEPWSAKYLYEPNTTSTPDGLWWTTDYDDSAWQSLEGPLSTTSYIYYNTEWTRTYATYWLRRTFTVESLDRVNSVYLYVLHDDGCVIYLNGTEIFSTTDYVSYYNPEIITLTDEQKALLHAGENLVAVQVRDTRGGSAFFDCGLYGYDAPRIVNPDFDQNYDGWTRTGYDLSRGGLSENYLMRSGSNTYGFDMHQDLPGAKTGLYRLRVQAFQMVGREGQSWYRYGKEPVSTRIYLNETSQTVKNIYDEARPDNIYRQNEYIQTGEGNYVPNYATSTSLAFSDGMYENSLLAYNDRDTMRIGIRFDETGQTQWTCFDNFRLEYISETDLDELAAQSAAYLALPMPADYRTRLTAMLAELEAAQGYEAKSRILVANSAAYDEARTAVENYAALALKARQLQARLDTTQQASPRTRQELAILLAEVGKALAQGTYSSRDCQLQMAELDALARRLDYVFLAFDITTPGSLGDSILNRVEYFADVTSLKVSGTLDNTDLTTLRERLTSLRELDMSGVKMKALPNQFFYNHTAIEQIVLPEGLETIGETAFYRCYALRHIDLPATLRSIGYYAFQECTNLREIVLPEGLTTLGDGAFYRCERATRLQLPTTLTDIPGSAFAYNYNLRQIDFAEGLVNIQGSAFYDCYNLDFVKFPNSLRYIGGNAFAYNITLSGVEFNEGLYQLGDNAFYDCDDLTEVTLPSSLVLANASPFDYCDNLRRVTCLSIEPPYMTDQVPYGVDMAGRELYVPALSLTVYKQSTGWDRFPVIKPIDYLPENITVVGDLRLTLPETIPAEYKPNVSLIHDQKGTGYWQYGSLTVNGEGTLSMADFSLIWDPNYQYDYQNRERVYCSLINNSHLRADNVTIDLFTRNDRWTFMALPFDVKVADIQTISDGTTNWVIRKYDGQARAAGETDQTWVRLTGDDEIKAGEGFIIQGSRYLNNSWQNYSGFRMKAINNGSKNNLFQTTDLTVALNDYPSAFTHNRSWNFIGNPYPSYYDTRFMQFQAPITVWDIRNNTYRAYSPADDAYILSPGEAFFVQRPVSEGSIVFGRDGRQSTHTARTLEAAEVKGESQGNQRTIANLTLTDGNQTDQTRIVLNEQAAMQYEMACDATKFMSSDATASQLYTTHDGIAYAINERPLADGRVALTVHVGKNGTHTIALANKVEGYRVMLDDKLTGKTTVLTDGEYTFTANVGDYATRFQIRFVGTATGVAIAEEQPMEHTPTYDMAGRKVTPKRGIYVQKGKKFMSNK